MQAELLAERLQHRHVAEADDVEPEHAIALPQRPQLGERRRALLDHAGRPVRDDGQLQRQGVRRRRDRAWGGADLGRAVTTAARAAAASRRRALGAQRPRPGA